jgi:hypothetical protein
LLSLLIAASFLTAGGWFCADGRACLPALSPACCCGDEGPGASIAAHTAERCDDAACGDCLSAQECGCYRDLPALASLPAAAFALLAVPSLRSAAEIIAPEPPALRLTRRPAAVFLPPPRFLVSARESRAPPVV